MRTTTLSSMNHSLSIGMYVCVCWTPVGTYFFFFWIKIKFFFLSHFVVAFSLDCTEINRTIKRIISWTLQWAWRVVVQWLVRLFPQQIRSFIPFRMGQLKRKVDRVNRVKNRLSSKWQLQIIMKTSSSCCTRIQIYWMQTMRTAPMPANCNILYYKVTPKYLAAAIVSNSSSAKSFWSNTFRKRIRLLLNWYKHRPYHRCH